MSQQPQFLIPLLEITPEGIVSKTGDITIGFELYKRPLFSLSTDDLAGWHQAIVKAIRPLPVNTVLHFQDRYIQNFYKAKVPDTAGSFLQSASEAHFDGRPFREHRCFCFLTRTHPDHRASNSATSSLLKKHLLPEGLIQQQQIDEFQEQAAQFERILSDSGLVSIRRLRAEELISDKDKPGIIEQYCCLTTPTEAALNDTQLTPHLQVGDRPCVLYTLADAELLPSQCSSSRKYEAYSTEITAFPIGFASPIGPLLDADHIYNQYIFLHDPAPVLSSLETRRRRLAALSTHSRKNKVAADAIGQFLDEAAESQRRPVKAHFNVFAWTDNPADLKDLKLKVSSAITRIGVIPHLETVGAPQIWWAGYPGNAGDFPINETFDTFIEQAACFLIPESNGRSSASPFGIRVGDRHSGYPLHVDISDLPMQKGQITNRNKFALGGSGGGKSFFFNHLIRCYYEQGSHIVLVDVGGSYHGLCQLLGGRYYTYDETKPLCFNPFRLEEGDRPDTEKKESIKTLLLALWKKGEEGFTRAEYVALSNALHGYYDHLRKDPQVEPGFNSFYAYLQSDYATLLRETQVDKNNFDLENFLYVLRPFYMGGEYDYLLNATEQASLLNERLIVFELDNIKDHGILFPVVTIIIMETFISKMRKLKGVRKLIVLEEAWKALAKEGMSEYIKYLFKTVRKFFGEAIVVTQDIEDIISSPIVKNTIINNADCKILLDQSKFLHRFQQVQDLLGLTEKDKTLVLSLNRANDPKRKYKEVFIGLANGPSNVYRTEVSLEEYLLYTTEESEKLMVGVYAAKHGGIRQGVATLAADIRSGAVQLVLAVLIGAFFLLAPKSQASAQVFDLVDAAIRKALVTADLKIQQLQTQTITLQNAQKALENSMQDGLLGDITGWVQQQELLYANYYQELWQVKSALTTYSRVSYLIARQVQLVKDYQQALAAVHQDPHFSAAEVGHIGNVYTGILNESIRTIGQLALVIQSSATQMDDAGRLRLIDATGRRIESNYKALHRWTEENSVLSLQRARNEQDIQTIKALYGIR